VGAPFIAGRFLCALGLGVALGFGAGACQLDSVDHGRTPCNERTCLGCCTANGVCLSGDNHFACGIGAGACRKCPDDQTCADGACAPLFPADGGPPADAGPTRCGPTNCFGCCLAEKCLPFELQGLAACGSAGAVCMACEDEPAVCDLGACVVPACNLKVTHPASKHPSDLEFGAAAVGSTQRIEVELQNLGEAACRVEAPRWLPGTDANAFSFAGQTVHQMLLEPQASARLPVTFTPYTAKRWDQQTNGFTFTVNDGAPSECASGERGCRRKVVLGEGVASALPPALLLSTSALDLGEVTVGCRSGWRTLMLVNAAPFSTTVDVTLSPGGAFELQAVGLPLTLPPWSSQPLRLRATASTAGPMSGSLVLVDSLAVTHTVPLTAHGVTTPDRSLITVQPAPAQVDVLVVMHDGPGMAQVQEALAQAAPAFVQRAQAVGGEYRVGVLTSGGSQAGGGLLQGSPKFITPASAAQLGSHLQVGQRDGGLDQSLEALRLATYPPIRTDVLRNGTFFREGHRLGVVFVSNAVEEKSGGGLVDYVSAVQVVAGGAVPGEGLRVVGVLSSGAGCSAGSDWQEVLSLFGGTCRALLPGGAADVLAQVADELLVPAREVALPSLPDLNQPVTVVVENAAGSAPAQFTVDAVRGVIRFEPLWIPSPGDQVHVSWQAACEP
jgi:hypothetical protein